MKRKVTYPNGVVEEMEGTPEEFQKLGSPQYEPFKVYPPVFVPVVVPYTPPAPAPFWPGFDIICGIPQNTVFSGSISALGATIDNGSVH